MLKLTVSEGTNVAVIDSNKRSNSTQIDSDSVDSKPVIRLINKLFVEAIRRKVSVDTSKITRQVPGKYRASTGQVAMEIERLIAVMHGEMKRAEIQDALDLRHRDYFNETYLIPALNAGYLEMTIPDKPTSSRQKYRLTEKGLLLQANLMKKGKL